MTSQTYKPKTKTVSKDNRELLVIVVILAVLAYVGIKYHV